MHLKMKHHLSSAKILRQIVLAARWTGLFLVFAAAGAVIGMTLFDQHYKNRIYPNVYIGGVSFAGQTPQSVMRYWSEKNLPFQDISFEFRADQLVATASGSEMQLGYDAALSAQQAYLVGRSGGLFTDIIQKFFTDRIDLSPMFTWKTDSFDQMIDTFAISLEIPPQDALFRFQNGKVATFRPSVDGRRLNAEKAKQQFVNLLDTLPSHPIQKRITVNLPVEVVKPQVTTESVNNYGIKDVIGTGYSEFHGSIASRIHNVALAASQFNGVLIPPDRVFSFDEVLGDISAATGYQSAYIIKDGRTVLGDGGGVCQVSTTLFRAALDAGLPIVERHAHAYRVHYYEEGGFKPGIDATIFSPSVDLKFKNDTGHYILIQTATDTKNMTLTFTLYGTRDGRVSKISNQKLWDVTPPPEPLYQDDPTLPPGTVKQVDWAAWGAKASFDYTVSRNGTVLEQQTFFSNFRPWQAVYLRGPQT